MISASSLAALSTPGIGGVAASRPPGIQTVRGLSGGQSAPASAASGTLRFDPSAPPPAKTLPRGSLLNLSA